MSTSQFNPEYVIHSDEEPLRLDRQARIYGSTDDLRFLSARPKDHVLDAGCGSGIITRTIAEVVNVGTVTGLDRQANYIDYARRAASTSGLMNAKFEVGNVTGMPFADKTFDIVWSKHLLQWVPEREKALAEFVRVAKPGGRVVCCNFDRFCLAHYPVNQLLQTELERWFVAASKSFGFDNDLGRKLPHMFQAAGLKDIQVDFIPDRAFCGFGGDPERRWNWQVQFESAFPFTVQVFGDKDLARDFTNRAIETFNDPNVYVYCTLFYVQGTVS